MTSYSRNYWRDRRRRYSIRCGACECEVKARQVLYMTQSMQIDVVADERFRMQRLGILITARNLGNVLGNRFTDRI